MGERRVKRKVFEIGIVITDEGDVGRKAKVTNGKADKSFLRVGVVDNIVECWLEIFYFLIKNGLENRVFKWRFGEIAEFEMEVGCCRRLTGVAGMGN